MPPTHADLVAALARLGPHQHLCSIYDTAEEQYASAVPFIRMGLERGEQCLYIADPGRLENARRALQDGGVAVDGAEHSGALRILTKDETYMRQGRFDPDWMFSYWGDATRDALAEGFTALRGTGETEWVERGGPGLERWMEYESRLTEMLARQTCCALCQYHRPVFPPEIILNVIRTHPVVVWGDTVCANFYHVPPREYLGSGGDGSEVERLLQTLRERAQMELALRAIQEGLEDRVRLRTRQLEVEAAERQRGQAKIEELNRQLELRVRDLSAANLDLEVLGGWLAGEVRAALRSGETAAAVTGRLDQFVELMEARRREPRREICDLGALAREALAEFQSEIGSRSVQVRLGDLPCAHCDAGMIRQVYRALLSNALKFTRPRSLPHIELGSDHGAVFVRDNGVGFSMKYVDRLFMPFQRLHRVEEFEGAGLGLALVRRLISRHGGRVWADAVMDRGASFYFTLE